jgi:hypothetical protein
VVEIDFFEAVDVAVDGFPRFDGVAKPHCPDYATTYVIVGKKKRFMKKDLFSET